MDVLLAEAIIRLISQCCGVDVTMVNDMLFHYISGPKYDTYRLNV